jgi:hypothetical protein
MYFETKWEMARGKVWLRLKNNRQIGRPINVVDLFCRFHFFRFFDIQMQKMS